MYVYKPTHVAAPSSWASIGRRTVRGRTEQRRSRGLKRYENNVRPVWGSFLIAAGVLRTPARKGYNALGVKGALQLLSKRYK